MLSSQTSRHAELIYAKAQLSRNATDSQLIQLTKNYNSSIVIIEHAIEYQDLLLPRYAIFQGTPDHNTTTWTQYPKVINLIFNGERMCNNNFII